MAAGRDRPLVRGERRGRAPALPNVRGGRLLRCAGRRQDPGLLPRRRLWACRLRGHRDRGRRRALRLLRGQARDRPCRHLSLRAAARGIGGAALLPHRRALRRTDGAPDRARLRGRGWLHARVADETVEIPSYLFSEEHIRAAKRVGADAIHPGYGFLAENPSFAEAVEAAEIAFVGPTPEALRRGGDKLEAKRIAR